MAAAVGSGSYTLMEPLWRIELFGGLKAQGPAGEFGRFRTQKARSLLAYLAFYAQRCHSRDLLAGMLWPDSSPPSARLNLRAELAFLRRHLEPLPAHHRAVLRADHQVIGFASGVVQTDVAEFESCLQTSAGANGSNGNSSGSLSVRLQTSAATDSAQEELDRLRRALTLYGKGLLPGWYDEWLLGEQERLANARLDALRRIIAILRTQGALEEAVGYAQTAASVGPLCEPAHVDLMTLYAETGRQADAARQYHQLERRLRETLNAAPCKATRRHFDALFAVDSTIAPPVSVAFASSAFRPDTSPPGSEAASSIDSSSLVDGFLPCPSGRFFGREAELEALCAQLHGGDVSADGARLTTLTGPAGSGKTRLASEAARCIRAARGLAVVFVSLAELPPSGSLIARLATVMRLPPAQGAALPDQVAAALRAVPMLLILDNFEHLELSAYEELGVLLARVETARFLVTSRHRLGLPGEREMPVLPLDIPGPDKETPEAVAACASAQMFADCAQAARPDFRITPGNAHDCAEICRRLDGLPLGIGLVAGQSALLTPAQMLQRLNAGETLTARSASGLSARHASLRAAIDWSWEMLDARMRALLSALTIFQGGWNLAAAQAVCAQPDVLAGLAVLRDRSLIVSEERDEEMRFRLLEPIRAFARERLTPALRKRLERRHSTYFHALAEQGRRENKRQTAFMRADQGNFLAALDHLKGSAEGVALATTLAAFWQREGRLEEAAQQLTRMREAAGDIPPGLRARSLFAQAALAGLRGEAGRMESLCAEAAPLCAPLAADTDIADAVRPLSDPALLLLGTSSSGSTGFLEMLLSRGDHDISVRAFTRSLQGKAAYFAGDYARAETLLQAGLAAYRQGGDRLGEATVLYLRGQVAVYRSDLEEATRLWQQCLAQYRALDFRIGIAMVTPELGYLARLQHDYAHAAALAQDAIALSRHCGLESILATALWLIGTVYRYSGQYAQAGAALEESLNLRRALGEQTSLGDTLSAQGLLACDLGDYVRARALCREALELRQQGTDTRDVATALGELGLVALCADELKEAEILLTESLQKLTALQDTDLRARILCQLALVACRSGKTALADQRLRECLSLLARGTNRLWVAEGLEACAELNMRQKRPETAAVLEAQATRLREAISAPPPVRDRLRRASQTLALQRALSREQLKTCCRIGHEMSWEHAIAYALEPIHNTQ